MIRQKVKKVRKSIKKTYRKYFTYEDSQHTLLSDKAYLKQLFKAKMGYELDLKNPKTFNEKLQWLKLYDRRPEYTTMVDKYAAKKYVADIIGEEHIIPTLGLYDSPDEIDFDALPNQFVLKCTHSSGIGNCICTDKSKLDIEEVKEGLRKGLEDDYYLDEREWPYKNVPRKIICEKYMVDESGYELKDYKFFCFDGEPMALQLISDRPDLTVDYYDCSFNHLPITKYHHYPNSKKEYKKPISFERMIEIAKTLSKNIPFVRIDLYDIFGDVYFGEFTFFPGGGIQRFEPEEWDYTFGHWLKLPISKYSRIGVDEQNGHDKD